MPVTHGLTVGGKTRTYISWVQMHARCSNHRLPEYPRYGGRGIKVCKRWSSYENFFFDMGKRPLETSLDRIDNNGNYEPGNCRWATRKEQSRNTRQNHLLTARGKTLPIQAWADIVGISRSAIGKRLRRGLSIEEAIFLPIHEGKRPKPSEKQSNKERS